MKISLTAKCRFNTIEMHKFNTIEMHKFNTIEMHKFNTTETYWNMLVFSVTIQTQFTALEMTTCVSRHYQIISEIKHDIKQVQR
jgi:hypothetical protein